MGEGWASAGALRALGGVLVVLGLLALPWCFVRLAEDGDGTPSPTVPTRALVVRGPYRLVRHPMYVVTATVIAGEGLLLSRPVLLAGAALYLAATGALALRREEPVLRARFGAAYDAYAARVPAFLPRARGRR